MQREIQLTGDGSHTIASPGMKVTYHSHHGAVGESMHVYIEAGLLPIMDTAPASIRILEIGFGTGLNAILSLREAMSRRIPVHYTAIEPYPLAADEIKLLNHGQILSMQDSYLQLHDSPWEQEILINGFFTLRKIRSAIAELEPVAPVNCIYFDSFSPIVQPELWTQPVFEKMYRCLEPGGHLVTYSSKSIVRRAMQSAGFSVKKIPGPWGKREMVRAERLPG
jgi:tRNA U34 5-methylaminomethyl-2-thiouridine-forming methyltransferase MnmC